MDKISISNFYTYLYNFRRYSNLGSKNKKRKLSAINSYSINNNNLAKIQEIYFEQEKYLQILNESNLEKIFKLKLIKSEFVTEELLDGSKYRYDSLAFDSIKRVFVIIEYKINKYSSLTDQFLSYLEVIRESRYKIMLTYNLMFNESLDVKDINWDKTEVLIIGTEFTKYQKHSFFYLYNNTLKNRISVFYAKLLENNTINLLDFFIVEKQVININNSNINNSHLTNVTDKNKLDEDFFYAPNLLLFSNPNLSLNSCRILYLLLYKVHNLTLENSIYVSEFVKYYALKNNTIYRQIKNICFSLNNLTLTYLYNYKAKENTQIVKAFDYLTYGNNGEIKYKFSDKFIDLYNKNSTVINFNSINKFSCKYSVLIYHYLLMEFQKSKSTTSKFIININLDELRSLLGSNDIYPRYSDFKLKVLKRAQYDINKNSDINFNFEPYNKYARNVATVKFELTFK